jgi:thioesterase domain-containing protein
MYRPHDTEGRVKDAAPGPDTFHDEGVGDALADSTSEAAGRPDVSVPGAEPRVRSGRAIPLRAAGTQRPLFLAHEGTGSVAYAHLLLPHLDPELPLYALPAASAPEPQLCTVEGMATRMARMIRQVQPAGPYRLAGWAFGGILAYEVAAQLIGQDQPVEFVGMIDTRHPAGTRAAPEDPAADHALLLRILRMGEGGEGSAGPESHEEPAGGETGLEALVAKGRVTAAHAAEMRERLRASRHALREYYPQPVPVPVRLFAARQGPGPDPRRGWQALLPDASLRVTPVPGTHPSMLEGDSLRSLGEALSREIGQAGASRTALPEDGYAPLVTLRFGKGGGAPLFCVPGAGASVAGLAELSGYLDPTRPVHAFQPRGLDGDMVPHSTVQAAAELYLRSLGQVHPTGPVHLLGHSFGGWVVFEMAGRLRAAGRTVGSLTILDSEVPDEDGAGIEEHDNRGALLELVDIFEHAAERSLEIGPDDVAPLDEDGRLKLLHERLVGIGLMPRRSSHEVLRGSFRSFATCLRTTYTPAETWPDPLHLVLLSDPRRDEETNQRQFAEAVRGWKRWAPNLVFSRGAGNHVTALKSPHVRSLASRLDADVAGGGAM